MLNRLYFDVSSVRYLESRETHTKGVLYATVTVQTGSLVKIRWSLDLVAQLTTWLLSGGRENQAVSGVTKLILQGGGMEFFIEWLKSLPKEQKVAIWTLADQNPQAVANAVMDTLGAEVQDDYAG